MSQKSNAIGCNEVNNLAALQHLILVDGVGQSQEAMHLYSVKPCRNHGRDGVLPGKARPVLLFIQCFYTLKTTVAAHHHEEQKQSAEVMAWRSTKLAALATSLLGIFASAEKTRKQPNIVFIITDDQDVHMQSLDYMPLLQKHIRDVGTTFENHYCTVSICCPSRVNIWTGRAAHNTNVTDLRPPYGGYPKFVEEGLNENWLPVWLQELGYNTYYTGKLFNAHSVDNYNAPPVNGFNGSDFLLDPYTYEYYGSKMSRNAAVPVSYSGQYSPDVIASKAYEFLDQATRHENPFFLAVAPIAPHSNVRHENGVPVFDLPEYAERHKDLFKDYKIPRTADFNPTHASGVSWVKGLSQLNETVIEYFDEFQRARLRSLQAVDEMVEQIVDRLDSQNLLDNTYIFYTTDNGFHIGQHRMQPGKECPFETDIHIPLAVRGPGIEPGATADAVTSHTDIAATVLKLAGSNGEGLQLDGTPIPLFPGDKGQGEHVNVEFWGQALAEGKFARIDGDSGEEEKYLLLDMC